MPTRKEATALLKRDHDEVRDLFEQLLATDRQSVKARQELLTRLETALKAHTKLEEELVYPAFHERAESEDDERAFYEAIEEHHATDVVLADVKEADPASPSFSGKIKVLKELVLRHARQEERKLFPRLKQLMQREQLVDLGVRLTERRNQLMNGVPSSRAVLAPSLEARH